MHGQLWSKFLQSLAKSVYRLKLESIMISVKITRLRWIYDYIVFFNNLPLCIIAQNLFKFFLFKRIRINSLPCNAQCICPADVIRV